MTMMIMVIDSIVSNVWIKNKLNQCCHLSLSSYNGKGYRKRFNAIVKYVININCCENLGEPQKKKNNIYSGVLGQRTF